MAAAQLMGKTCPARRETFTEGPRTTAVWRATELPFRAKLRYASASRTRVQNVRVDAEVSGQEHDADEASDRRGSCASDRIALSGIATGADLGAPRFELYPLHPKNDTFPGEVFLELAADAIDAAGASREQPIEFEGIRERYLPECTAHTKVQHQHSKYALRAAAMIRAGVDPGLLDEVVWWQGDDLGVGSRRVGCLCAGRG
jgi:hypothetical protein